MHKDSQHIFGNIFLSRGRLHSGVRERGLVKWHCITLTVCGLAVTVAASWNASPALPSERDPVLHANSFSRVRMAVVVHLLQR